MTRRLSYGMVGGGPGAFIGDVHRMAAELDGLARIAAGAFSSDPERSAAKGAEIGLDPARVYGSYGEMAAAEAARAGNDRLDFVIVVTPNHLHFDVSRTFLEAGFHVVCDKPLTTELGDAEALCRLVAAGDRVFALTHNYGGYPMVKDARHLVRGGTLGEIRRVQLEYFQGWLATPLEETGHAQAAWRTDPARAGVAGALGDIGTHAHHLARYVTGLEVEALCGELTTFVPGRRLEDDASLLMRWSGGVRGTLTVSQVAAGEENGLAIRVFGSEGSIAWRHGDAETLWHRTPDGRARARRRGHGWISPEAARASRVPPGHPEGFIEGFGNLYRNAISTIGALDEGRTPDGAELDFPTVWDGARGVHFLERAVESGRRGAWVDARYEPPGEPPAEREEPGESTR
ncbi:MAG: Gfo/Idh/MocA family oxidoreductase [Gemmatimonadales bacterium]|nr:Gfo/Idh/MocA family oxidoreductase [Candidatus Palauibacter irciniicola]MYC18895.1 Gfo/Idh/MocA family oxidoreductase [Gemmatimonadales bacterium]